MTFRHRASALIWLVGAGVLALSIGVFFAVNTPTQAQQTHPPKGAPKAAPKAAEPKPAEKPVAQSSPPAAPAPGAPVRTETVVYDAWTVACRDTVDGKTKKVCSASLQMVVQQESKRVPLGAWLIARSNEGSLLSLLQTPQIDIGVLITKGIELKLGNNKPHKIAYVACTPQKCEGTMPMDDPTIKELNAAAAGAAVVSFWKADGAEFAITIASIKGIDKAIAAVR
jgi:invasion protein IalB